LFGFTGDVLEDGEGGVDTSTFFEEGTDGTTGTFWGDEDDVDVGGGNDAGKVFIDNGKAVGEIECLGILNTFRKGLTFPLVRRGLILGQVSFWAASLC
jgi:hypothetical protein